MSSWPNTEEPAGRITVSAGASYVSQLDPTSADHYTVVLTRKPENNTKVQVTSRAPRGVKFTHASDGVVDEGPDKTAFTADDGDSVTFTFDSSNWNDPQTAYFTAYQAGTATIVVGNGGGNGVNAKQALALQATEGKFKLSSTDPILGAWTTPTIAFDI